MERRRILIVDDSAKQRASLVDSLNDYHIAEAGTLQEAQTEILATDAVLVSPERVTAVLRKALRFADLARENRMLRKRLRARQQRTPLIGASPAMQRIREDTRLVAATKVPVVVTGDSGSGKEIVAREVHRLSDRHLRPLALINFAIIPAAAIDRELFGTEEGTRVFAGKLETANGGTIILDEICDAPHEIQAKLVGAIESGQILRDGSARPIDVDVRFIATTSKPLSDLVERGSFRRDLFNRLNVVPISIPPLRERREDIPMLASHFIEAVSRSTGKASVKLTEGAMRLMCDSEWPGNVRELKNLVERLGILASGATIDEDYFDFDDERARKRAAVEKTFRHGSIREMEKLMITHRLRANEQNRTHTAKTLKISVRTLRNKLRAYRNAERIRT